MKRLRLPNLVCAAAQIPRIDFWISVTRAEAVILGWEAPILRGRSCKIAGGLGRIQREFAQKSLPAGIGGGDLLELLQIALTRIRIPVKSLDPRHPIDPSR
jgi:hypothetical protein